MNVYSVEFVIRGISPEPDYFGLRRITACCPSEAKVKVVAQLAAEGKVAKAKTVTLYSIGG